MQIIVSSTGILFYDKEIIIILYFVTRICVMFLLINVDDCDYFVLLSKKVGSASHRHRRFDV